MKQIKIVLAMVLFISMAFGTLTLTTGCKEQGPMEEAGEAIDDAAKDAADAAEEAGEEVKDAVKDATN